MAAKSAGSNVLPVPPVPPVISDLEFCPLCGSILPLVSLDSPIIKCQRCHFHRGVQDYKEVVEEFTIHFNAPRGKKEKERDIEPETPPNFIGPTIERQCPRCKCEIMTYTTRQTRSADEGQTVFYMCIECKFQDIEYS